jgi:glycosyltransferase involved in cell wall biosynthesis
MSEYNKLPLASTSLTLIIPAYNEEKSILSFLPDVLSFVHENNFGVIVINDGSKDKTWELLKTYEGETQLKIVFNKVNRGYGGALKRGIEVAETEYVIMIDADGQHYLEDVLKLYLKIKETDADMIIGSRKGQISGSHFRKFGKWLIRSFARILMPMPIHDLNSGMKIFRTELGKKYLHLYPDTMAFSDILALVFINNRHLVLEEPIKIRERKAGESTINVNTAFQTVMEILNIIILFNPMKIFLPISLLLFLLGFGWGLRFFFKHLGVSIGSSMLLMMSVMIFLLGLIAEQLSAIRKNRK